MKLSFRLFLFFFLRPAFGFIIITYNQQRLPALHLKHHLARQLSLPLALMKLKHKQQACAPEEKALLHICLSDDSKILYPVIQQEFLQQGFQVFLND